MRASQIIQIAKCGRELPFELARSTGALNLSGCSNISAANLNLRSGECSRVPPIVAHVELVRRESKQTFGSQASGEHVGFLRLAKRRNSDNVHHGQVAGFDEGDNQ